MSIISAELGVSAAGLSLNSANVRRLAGIGSGGISFANFYGKTNVPPVNYTLTMGYESNSGMALYTSAGGYGTLTPSSAYRGVGITQMSSLGGTFAMQTGGNFLFTTLIIGGVTMDRSAASISNDGTSMSFQWNYGFVAGPYSMSLSS
jgi:hypothetical protein